MNDLEPKSEGGDGGGLKRSELAVLERAIRKAQVFEITDKSLKDLPASMEEMAIGKRNTIRARIAAAKVLVAMVGHNLKVVESEKDPSLNVNISGGAVPISIVEVVRPTEKLTK